jgi:two-component system NtrC family sensor kinase
MVPKKIVNWLIATHLLLFIMLTCQVAFAQSNISIKWGRFDLLAVDTTWKYKSGTAKPEYFNPEFNDQDWQTISRNYIGEISPASPGWTGIGIFRKRFVVPDSLKGRKAELFLTQFGISEIYLDGKMLCHFGSMEGKDDQIVTQRAVPFTLDSAMSHVLAIYYANHVKPSLIYKYGLIGYGIALSPSTPIEGDDNYYFHHMMISLGIILCFCLFFWCVFAFYPYRLASLISALQLTNFSLIFLGGMLRDYVSTDFRQFILGETLWEIGFSCAFGWSLVFIHTLYYKKLTWRTWTVGCLMFITILLVLFQSKWWFNVAVILIAVYLVEIWRMLILGLRKRRTGFWILTIGLFLSIAGTLFIIFDVFHVFPWYITDAQNILGIATDLSFPLALALHLAWEFGSANRDLRKQLLHVKELSKKTLEQEKEKQQILSTQNEMLDQQVNQRTKELNNSLNDLKSTQAQLIQSEKMASLGELTAGIAHEIQNPLNFVNNFSEVNNELIGELVDEADKGNTEEVKVIAEDIKQNLEKINHHGKRADAIVKGMLQHTRTSSGQKELTDINALCDEYLRLAYHGLRAKDKSFNAKFETDFDPSVGKINIVPQDIGRVLLNLINNAFYAVSERQKVESMGYESAVMISTKKSGSTVEIKVKDNGNGVPQNIIDKIFQPFFIGIVVGL